MTGNCIGACEMLGLFLQQEGIKSYTAECQVFIKSENSYAFIGFDNANDLSQIDTHTVLIVLLEEPLLLDVSIAYALPAERPIILEKFNNSENSEFLGKYTLNSTVITYQAKKNLRLPNNLQKTLLQTIIAETKSVEQLRTFKIILFITAGISLINFTLNMILIILKLLYL